MVERRAKPGCLGRCLRWGRLGCIIVLSLIVFSVFLVMSVRFINPPATPLMIIRATGHQKIDYRWTPLEQIAPSLQQAVMAAEDQRFIDHDGFDWNEIQNALEENENRKKRRGASTISMQVARNLFLWPGGGWFRKGLEAYFTVLLETCCSKYRIMEIYLNIAEWGPGVFGAEAAAAFHFHKPAARLTHRESASLAAILPSPNKWSPNRPGPYTQKRIETIASIMNRFKPVSSPEEDRQPHPSAR